MTIRHFLTAAAFTAGLLASTTLGANAAGMTVGFSQIGSESGWRAAETSVTKAEARKARHRPEIRRRPAEAGKPDQGDPLLHRARGRRDPRRARRRHRLGQRLKEAKEAEIPVVLLDRQIDAPDDLT